MIIWVTLTFIRNDSCMGNQNFLGNFAVDLDEIKYVAATCCFVEAYA